MSIENKRFDVWIPLITCIFMFYGYMVLKSAVFKNPGYEMYPFRQLIWDLLAIIFMFSMIFVKKRFIREFAVVVYVVSVFLLVVVLFRAPEIGGSRRWISFGVVNFQPSELAKFSIVILLPAILEKPTLKRFVMSILFVALPMALILVEPDLGTTVLIGLVWLSIVLASKVKLRYILVVLLVILVALPVFYFYGLKDYQRRRIEAFFNPEKFSKTAAYNTLQSKNAIGSGGFFGKGYMKGPANIFNFVPVDYSDFIAAVIGEELGFAGISLLVMLYFLLMLRFFQVYQKVGEEYWRLVIVGVSAVFFFHVVENLLMCVGATPVTGIPLPFISYGGSSTFIFGGMLGLVMKAYAISKTGRKVEVL